MMLRERWVVAVALGMCLVSAAVTPGQSQAPPNSPSGQQNQNQNQDKNNNPDTDDAEPATFHPPAVIGQPDEPVPPVESHPSTAPNAPVQSSPPAQVAAPASALIAVKEPAPEPPLSNDPVERQLQIDTAHLLQLTEELKTEIDKAGSNTLSLAALRKADEVQKLARELKERMKDRGQVIQSKP
jgi:hypothetical protein